MSNILKIIEGKKYILLCFFWLPFLVWRTSVFLNSTPPPFFGIVQGMAFASHHSYQRGVKAYLKRLDPDKVGTGKEQQEFVFPLSYSGTFNGRHSRDSRILFASLSSPLNPPYQRGVGGLWGQGVVTS